MNVATTAQTDDLTTNLELAKLMAASADKIHLVKSDDGSYRVRITTKNGNRVVNYKNQQLAQTLQRALGVQISSNNGVFHATIPGQRASAKADSRYLAIALATLRAPINPGALQVAL